MSEDHPFRLSRTRKTILVLGYVVMGVMIIAMVALTMFSNPRDLHTDSADVKITESGIVLGDAVTEMTVWDHPTCDECQSPMTGQTSALSSAISSSRIQVMYRLMPSTDGDKEAMQGVYCTARHASADMVIRVIDVLRPRSGEDYTRKTVIDRLHSLSASDNVIRCVELGSMSTVIQENTQAFSLMSQGEPISGDIPAVVMNDQRVDTSSPGWLAEILSTT